MRVSGPNTDGEDNNDRLARKSFYSTDKCTFQRMVREILKL